MLFIFDSLNLYFHLQADPKPLTIDLLAEGYIKKPERQLDLKKKNITASESFHLLDFYKKQLTIYDLRASELYSRGSIDLSINISKKALLTSPEAFFLKDKVYLVYGQALTENELSEMRKHCKKLYYMSSDFQEWQIAAMKYFETVIK